MTLVDTRTPDQKRLIAGATGDWEVVIGMEVHAQVTSDSKLFSGASTAFGGAPNSPTCRSSMRRCPGMLPVINEECVRQAIRTGLGLKAQINLRSVFDRKNYFLSRPAAGLPDLAVQAARSSARARSPSSVCRIARASEDIASASSGSISSRTPASRCTTSIRR
jgi:hypothetical protein